MINNLDWLSKIKKNKNDNKTCSKAEHDDMERLKKKQGQVEVNVKKIK